MRRDLRLLRVRVLSLEHPPLVFLWQAGRVTAEGLEDVSNEALRAALPGLTLARRVAVQAGPGAPEKYCRELAETVRAEHAEMSARLRRKVSWAEVGARHGLDRRRTSDLLRKYPPA
jgi:hypothetical protein